MNTTLFVLALLGGVTTFLTILGWLYRYLLRPMKLRIDAMADLIEAQLVHKGDHTSLLDVVRIGEVNDRKLIRLVDEQGKAIADIEIRLGKIEDATSKELPQ